MLKNLLSNTCLFALVCCWPGVAGAQHALMGSFKAHAGATVTLTGFHGLKASTLHTTVADAQGQFSLPYGADHLGMGMLQVGSDASMVVVLEPGGVVLKGTHLMRKDSLRILQGQENRWFNRYAVAHAKRERVLSGWLQMQHIYAADTFFATHSHALAGINQEIQRLQTEDAAFVAALPSASYMRWYLPNRSFLSRVQNMVQTSPEEIPQALAAYRSIAYTDTRWYSSGLLRDILESHFWLIENSSSSPDTVLMQMKASIDAVIGNIAGHEEQLNDVATFLFKLFEKYSLYEASAYLALKVLNEVSCTVNSDLAFQLETYRAMRIGNTAPDLVFTTHTTYPSHIRAKKVSELQAPYTLVVFAAGWCQNCRQEIPKMASLYASWRTKGVEVVLVSLDETTAAFTAFTASLPFICTTDLQKWDSPMAKAYHVFGTPTMFLLDKNRKIILRPVSAQHLNDWVNTL